MPKTQALHRDAGSASTMTAKSRLPLIDPKTRWRCCNIPAARLACRRAPALSHANIYINAKQIQLWFHVLDNPETRIVGVLPLFMPSR
jgi:hypothetical protein